MEEQEKTSVPQETPRVGRVLEESKTRDEAAERFGKGIELLKSAFELGRTIRDLPTTKAATDYQEKLKELTDKTGHGLEALGEAFREAETGNVSRKQMLAAGNVLNGEKLKLADPASFARISVALTQFADANDVKEDVTAKLLAALQAKGMTRPEDFVAALASTARLAKNSNVPVAQMTSKLTEALAKGGAKNFQQAATQVAGTSPAAKQVLERSMMNGGQGGSELETAHAAALAKKRNTSKELWEAANTASDSAMVAIGDALRPATDFMARSMTSTANGLVWLANTFPGTVASVGSLGAAVAAIVATIMAARGVKKVVGGALDYLGGFRKGGPGGSGAGASADAGAGGVQDVRVINWPAGFGAGGMPGDALGDGPDQDRNGRTGNRRSRIGRAWNRVRRVTRSTGLRVLRGAGQARQLVGRGLSGAAQMARTGGRAVGAFVNRANEAAGGWRGIARKGLGVGVTMLSLAPTLLGPSSKQEKARALGGAAGAATGALAGAAIGSVIGTFLGGPVGLPIGKVIGGYIGSHVGEFAGRKLAAAATPSTPLPRPAVQPGAAVPALGGARTNSSQFSYAPQITINVPAAVSGVQGLAEQVASLLYERFRRADAVAARGMLGDQPFPMMGRA